MMSVWCTEKMGEPAGEGAAGVNRCRYTGISVGQCASSWRTVVATSATSGGRSPHADEAQESSPVVLIETPHP
jgi:hypothetical protein